MALIFLFIASWHSSNILNLENVNCNAYDVQKTNVGYGDLQNNKANFGGKSVSQVPESEMQNKTGSIPETKSPELIPEKKALGDLKEVLSSYYEGKNFLIQERAFRRVIKWKVDLEDIARNYTNVDWKKLSAVIKAETEGRTGNQVSSAKAVGLTQIKYQGAWAFVWDAMFSKKIKQGSRFVKDYHNAGIRRRYRNQLDRIEQHLKENAILVRPADSSKTAYNTARSRSW